MFKTFSNAWKIDDLRKKLLWTLLLVVIYRLGCFIPVPGINPGYINSMVGEYNILGFLNLMTGGSFGNFTWFAMGISPYITASIIMQLLAVAIPALERLQKEGEEGRKKITQITRILGIVFAMVMSVGIILGLGEGAVVSSAIIPPTMSYITIGLVITSGTAFLMWLGEKITEVGIGNGISFIIFASIVSQLPTAIIGVAEMIGVGQVSFWIAPILLLLILVIVCGVTCVDLGERKIPVQYAKRVVGRKMYGGQSTSIPMRVNANGVLPLIFAMTLMQIPGMIGQFWPNGGFYQWYVKYLGTGSVLYFVIYVLLIIGFSYFYSSITFNPIDMSKNLQQNGGFIPGIRPGKPTSDYMARISNRLTFFSAMFCAVIAAVPTFFSTLLGSTGAAFGATSLLILISVALETSKTLEAQITMRHYKGFLK